MRRFQIKDNISNKEREVRNLKDNLEFCGEITIYTKYDNSNNNIPSESIVYYDKEYCFFRKQFIDMFYDEIL